MDTPEGAQNIEGLVIPAATSAPSGAGAATAGVSASAENIRQRKERKDKGQSRGPRGERSAESIPALSATQFAKLYDPEIWQKAICAPADAMAAITAKPYWEVSQKEREAVGVTGSIAAQCFAVTDPRWLAASLAIITVLDVYGIRLALWMADLKKERQEELERKRAAQRG